MPHDPVALEARFQQLVSHVSTADWERLVKLASERVMRRLAAAEVVTDASPEQLQAGLQQVGAELVAFLNVALTSVAQGELGALE